MDEFIHKELFEKIENKTKIKSEDIFAVVDSVKDANFKDEETIRYLVRQLSSLANVPVSEDIEDSIIDSIINHNGILDFNHLGEITDKK
ncbi:MAG TPA: stage VI sporulation protein F [Bacillales bacterium]|nr:stage VI sporulation protein F [Bacillales bacterium]